MSGSGSTPTGYSAFSASLSRYATSHPALTLHCEIQTRHEAECQLDWFKTDDTAVFLVVQISHDSEHVESIVEFLTTQWLQPITPGDTLRLHACEMNGMAGFFKRAGTGGVLNIPHFHRDFKAWARYWAAGQLPANGQSHGGFSVPHNYDRVVDDVVVCNVRVGPRSEISMHELEQ